MTLPESQLLTTAQPLALCSAHQPGAFESALACCYSRLTVFFLCLGQSFSTTREVKVKLAIKHEPDIRVGP